MKNRWFFTGILCILLVFVLMAAGCDDGDSGNPVNSGNNTGSDTAVTLISASANGSATQTTTQLTLTFSQVINYLSSGDIFLSGIAGVNKGSLSGSGPVYTLAISGFTEGGTLNVTVLKTGYIIGGLPQTAGIFYYSGGGNNTGDGGNTGNYAVIENFDAPAVSGTKNNFNTITNGHIPGIFMQGELQWQNDADSKRDGDWGCIFWHGSTGDYFGRDFPTAIDLSAFDKVSFWAKLGTGDPIGASYQATLTDINGLQAGMWFGFTTVNTWEQFVYSFADFPNMDFSKITSWKIEVLDKNYAGDGLYFDTFIAYNDSFLNAPTGVTATALSTSSISLSWNTVSGAVSYKVYYEIGSSTTKNLAGTVAGTSYTHTGLQEGVTYCYYITAVNSDGEESAYSGSTYATTQSDTPAITFSSVSANGSSSQTTTQLTLTFSDSISGLSASDITLSGVSGVNKGTLDGYGPTYTLGISGFSSSGTLTVAVEKYGYVINGSPKTASIYYYSAPQPNTNPPGTPTLTATKSGNNITLKWSFPTGSSYTQPTSIKVRLHDPQYNVWVDVTTLSGTATSYTFNSTMWVDSSGWVMLGIVGENSYGSGSRAGTFNTSTGVLY